HTHPPPFPTRRSSDLARGGTKSKTAEELEERLAFLAAELESTIEDRQGSPQGRLRLNLLSKDLDEGLAIIRECLSAPRFQENKLDRKSTRLNSSHDQI